MVVVLNGGGVCQCQWWLCSLMLMAIVLVVVHIISMLVVVDLTLRLTIAYVSWSVAYANHSPTSLVYLNLVLVCLPVHINLPVHLNPKLAHIPR